MGDGYRIDLKETFAWITAPLQDFPIALPKYSVSQLGTTGPPFRVMNPLVGSPLDPSNNSSIRFRVLVRADMYGFLIDISTWEIVLELVVKPEYKSRILIKLALMIHDPAEYIGFRSRWIDENQFGYDCPHVE